MGEEEQDRTTRALLAVLIIATGTALWVPNDPTIATVVLAAASLPLAVSLGEPRTASDATRLGDHLLPVAAAIQLGLLLVYVLDHVDVATANGAVAVVALAVTGLVGGDALRRRPRLGAWSPLVVVASFAILAVAWLVHARGATIDVLVFQEQGVSRLVHGINPYLPGYPDIYPPEASARFFGPGLSVDGVLQFGFPYPPLSLLLAAPGALLGDPRISQVAALVMTTWLVMTMVPGSRWSRAAGVLFVTSPTMLNIVENSWTDAYVVLLLALAIWGRVRRTRWSIVLLGCLVAVKQYAVLLAAIVVMLVPDGRSVRERLVSLSKAVAVAAAITLPFALWDPGAFWLSVVEFQFLQPIRDDAMSLVVMSMRWVGWPPPAWSTPILLVGTTSVLVLVLRHVRRGWDRAPSAAALVLLVFVLLAKQAFLNYYLVVTGCLLVGLSLASPSRDDPVSQEV